MYLGRGGFEALEALVQNGSCAAEVVAGDAEGVEDLMVRGSGCEVECLLTERSENVVKGVC